MLFINHHLYGYNLQILHQMFSYLLNVEYLVEIYFMIKLHNELVYVFNCILIKICSYILVRCHEICTDVYYVKNVDVYSKMTSYARLR